MPHNDHPTPYPTQHPPPFGSGYPRQIGYPPRGGGYPPQASYQPQLGYTSQSTYPPPAGYPQLGNQIQSHSGYPTHAGQPTFASQPAGYSYLVQTPYPVHIQSSYGSTMPFSTGQSPYQSPLNPVHAGFAPYPAAQSSYSTATSSIPSTGHPSDHSQYNHQPPCTPQHVTLPSCNLYPNLFGSGIKATGTKSKVGLIFDNTHTLSFWFSNSWPILPACDNCP